MFASEIKAFLDHPKFKKELNKEILSSYLCFNSTPTEETFFKGVYRVEPGYQILYKDGKINKTQFFKLEFDEKMKTWILLSTKLEKPWIILLNITKLVM